MQKFIIKIDTCPDEFLSDEAVCCFIFDAKDAKNFVDVKTDKIKLLQGQDAAQKCKDLSFDGVFVDVDSSLPIKRQVASVQEIIGSKKFLGLLCEPSRHEAMLASETEPDFLAFRISEARAIMAQDLINWYNELFLIQSAVSPMDSYSDFAQYDTDFVILNEGEYKKFVAKK